MPASKISVLVPAWQATRYIGECLDSIYAQQPSGFEVIVGIDGCRETLGYLLRERPARWPALRVLWGEKNSGDGTARNTLARFSRRDYLVFFDSDDIMLPGLIEWCFTRLDKPQVGRFKYVERREDGQGNVIGMRNPSINSAAGVFGIRRDSFLSTGGFVGWEFASDSEFQRRAYYRLGKAVTSPEPLFIYRRHPASMTASKTVGMGTPVQRRYARKIFSMCRDELMRPVDGPVAEMVEV